jgi:hypothetical protein
MIVTLQSMMMVMSFATCLVALQSMVMVMARLPLVFVNICVARVLLSSNPLFEANLTKKRKIRRKG